MRINSFFLFVLLTLFLTLPQAVSAQGMMGGLFGNQSTSSADEASTAQDEVAGKLVFDKLQSKQTTCPQLTDDDFDVLGDYYMGQMAGSTANHAQMNTRMTQMMGEIGQKQMHITLGKRLSGCNTQAAYSNNSNSGFAPMMGFGGGITGGWGMMNNFNNGMFFNWMPMVIFWILIALAIVWLIKQFTKSSQVTPLDVLKKRYANGEISKKEFEEMVKNIS